MKLTQITVSYGETQSLPEYSNTKPQLTLTAALDDGDDPAAVEAELWGRAKAAVHEQIDLALESCGKAAKYSTEPRYQVMRTAHDRYRHNNNAPPNPPPLVVVLPNEMSLDDRFVHVGWPESRKLRYAHALQIAQERAQEIEAPIVDCADGDLSRLANVLPSSAVNEDNSE